VKNKHTAKARQQLCQKWGCIGHDLLPKLKLLLPKLKLLLLKLKLFIFICLLGGLTSNVYALGLGSASSDSYLGQIATIKVPLLSVQNSDSLEIKVMTQDAQPRVSDVFAARLERNDSGFAIVVSSNRIINDPYVGFSLAVTEGRNTLIKEIGMLLDVSPEGVSSAPDNNVPAPSSGAQLVKLSGSDTMGPYDWAEAENIPKFFGPVLDGQSLWRVARRINKALGVSINQMMLSLYQANPAAFSRASIDSLQFGLILNIPDASVASQVSDTQAKAKLDSLSSNQIALLPESYQTQAIEQSEELVVEPLEQELVSPIVIEQAAQIEPQEQQTIGVIESEPLVASNLATNKEPSSDINVESSSVVENQPVAQKVNLPKPLQTTEASNKLVGDSNADALSNLLFWLVPLALFGLSVAAYFFHQRQTKSKSKSKQKTQVNTEASIQHFSPSVRQPRDYSTLTAVTQQIAAASIDVDTEMASYDSMSELHSTKQTDSETEPTSDNEDGDSGHLNFSEHFKSLLAKPDYAFARQLLDFTRDNKEITIDRYHCERLQILHAMQNTDGFYDYFYEIEADIPLFDLKLRTRISQMLVTLTS